MERKHLVGLPLCLQFLFCIFPSRSQLWIKATTKCRQRPVLWKTPPTHTHMHMRCIYCFLICTLFWMPLTNAPPSADRFAHAFASTEEARRHNRITGKRDRRRHFMAEAAVSICDWRTALKEHPGSPPATADSNMFWPPTRYSWSVRCSSLFPLVT